MQPQLLKSDQHYVRFSVDPPTTDALTVRKALQDALLQSFGLTAANIYIDILWIAEGGGEVVIRVGSRYVQTQFDFHDILIDTLLYHS